MLGRFGVLMMTKLQFNHLIALENCDLSLDFVVASAIWSACRFTVVLIVTLVR